MLPDQALNSKCSRRTFHSPEIAAWAILAVCTPTQFTHRWWTAPHSPQLYRSPNVPSNVLSYVRRNPTDFPHRPKQPHAVPYPACQPATQLDLDHHSSPFLIEPTQHRTATACRLQRACRPATMPLHCVSPPSRLSQVPPAFVTTLAAVLLFSGRAFPAARTDTRRQAPNRRLHIAAFVAHPVQRLKSCSPPSAVAALASHAGIHLVLRLRDLHRLRDLRPRSCTHVATSLESTLAHSSSTRLLH